MNDGNPLISVVIPVFNRKEYITDAVKSVISQSYRNWEIILVDDGSSDGSIEICQDLASDHEKISFYSRDRAPKGAPTCRNIGISHSKGEYVQFLDSDDTLFPDKFQRQLDMIKSSKEAVDIIHGSFIEKREDNGKERVIITRSFEQPHMNLIFSLGNTCANLFSKNGLEQVNGWSEDRKSGQEPDLMFRMYKSGVNTIVDSIPSTFIRVLQGGITISNQDQNYVRYAEYIFDVYEYLKLNKLILNQEDIIAVQSKVFNVSRRLYRLNEEEGYSRYMELAKDGISPNSKLELSSLYRILFRVLGFRLTEKLYQLIGR